MIAASDPLEYQPGGREIYQRHPGSIANQKNSEEIALQNESVLLKKFSQVNISGKKGKEFWLVRENDNYGEEELYCSGKVAVHSKGSPFTRILKKSYSCESNIEHAIWSRFHTAAPTFVNTDKELDNIDDDEDSYRNTNRNKDQIECICLFDSHTLKVFTEDGEDFVTSLEFPISSVWSTKYGIIMEKCQIPSLSHYTTLKSSRWTDSPPVVFSLTHPLNEISPVLIKHGGVNYVRDSSQQIIFTSLEPSLAVIYDTKTGLHSVYKIRKVFLEERFVVGEITTNIMNSTTASPHHAVKSSTSKASLSLFGVLNPQLSSINTSHFGSRGASFTTSCSVGTPSPSQQHQNQHSRSHSPMATISRCQSPTHPGFSSHVNNSIGSIMHQNRLMHQTAMANMMNSTQQTNINSFYYQNTPVSTEKSPNPEICLEHVWTENSGVQKDNLMGKASKAFFTTDLVGQSYLGYLVTSKSQLYLVRLEKTNYQQQIIFGVTTSIVAKDSINIPSLNMIATIDLSNSVNLYSGITCVGKVHITNIPTTPSSNYFKNNLEKKLLSSPFPRRSSLIPQHVNTYDSKFEEALHRLSPVAGNCNKPPILLDNIIEDGIIGIRDTIGKSITLEYNKKIFYRVTLPTFSTSPLVTKCLETLKSVLQKDLAMQLLVKWYGSRNAPGTQEFSLNQEWHLFMVVLFTLLGYDVDKLPLIHRNDEDSNGEKNSPIIVPKKQKTNDTGSQEDWTNMLNSVEHKNSRDYLINVLHLNKFVHSERSDDLDMTMESEKTGKISTKAILFPHLSVVLFSLHLLYEELKLNCLMSQSLPLLAQLLHQLSIDLQFPLYTHHYFLDYPTYCSLTSDKSSQISDKSRQKIISLNYMPSKPPSVFETLNDLLINAEGSSYPYLNRVNPRSKNIIQLTALIANESYSSSIDVEKYIKVITSTGNRNMDYQEIGVKQDKDVFKKVEETNPQRIILLYHELGMTKKDLDILPPGISLLLKDVMHKCRENPPVDWPTKTYELIERQDLAALEKHSRTIDTDVNFEGLNCNSNGGNINSVNGKSAINSTGSSSNSGNSINSNSATVSNNNNNNNNNNGSNTNSNSSSNSSGSRDNDKDDGMSFNDTVLKLRFNKDHRVAEVKKLLNSSKPVRIAITQRPDVSDHEFIEEQERHLYAVCSRIMALPIGRGMFTLRTSTPVITEQLPIPKLCLTGKSALRGTTIELCHIDVPSNMNLWPLFHNGVAAGLRIHPDASDINSTWIVYNKPQQSECVIEHSGFLMALGLNGHLKNLTPFNMFEYLVECHETTTVGLLIGLSATHRGTMDVSMTKLLSLNVETLLPPTSIELNIQQNVQVAALMGVGLVYEGTAHRHIANALLSEIGRPPGPEMKNCVDRESYSLAAGLALGLVVLGRGGGNDLSNIPDTLHYYMVGGNIRPFTGSQKEKYKSPSYQIREGDSINIDVTSPGATIALGLMYFNTGNQAVAEWMRPPRTQFLLDFVRPDLLLLRVLARSLIVWDEIEPTQAWFLSNVPDIVYKYRLQKPTCDVPPDVDLETMNQAYCNIIAGACMALGLKYAGSANEKAFEILFDYTKKFVELSHKTIGELAGKSTIETCLNVSLLSAAVVMAGTGNLKIIRLCRHIRSRVGPASSVVTYGSHLATHMALGLNFLGGGRYTLSNSPNAIAALIISLFPKFPTHSNDNRYHLQAFRHFYVLAAEPRLILPRDIDNRQHCYATVKLTFKSERLAKGQECILKAPCLLPQLDTLEKVELKDDRYWEIIFERGHNWNRLEGMLNKCDFLDVKQKAGHLSYVEDPHGYKSLIAQTLTTENVIPWAARQEHITSFTNDKTVLNIVKYFLQKIIDQTPDQICEIGRKKSSGKISSFLFNSSSNTSYEKMDTGECSTPIKSIKQLTNNVKVIKPDISDSEKYFLQTMAIIVYECVIKDKISLLPLWVNLYKSVEAIERKPMNYFIWQIKLISSYMLLNKRAEQTDSLLSIESVLSIEQRVALIIDSWEPEMKRILERYTATGTIETSPSNLRKFTAYCTFYNIPFHLNNDQNLIIKTLLSSNPRD